MGMGGFLRDKSMPVRGIEGSVEDKMQRTEVYTKEL